MNGRLLAVFFLAFIHACASYQAATAPSLSLDAAARQQRSEESGISLMAKAMHREADLKRYFDDDPIKYGVLPVQIHVENRTHGTPVLCSCDGMNLIDDQGVRMTALSVDQVMDEIKRSHWRTAGWTVGFGVFGLIPSAVNVNKVNKQMRADLESKIFIGGQLPEGDVEEGFLFFAVPQTLDSLDGWKLVAVIADDGEFEDVTLEQRFSGRIAPRTRPETLEEEGYEDG
jgi:hypothetical protein